MAFARGVLVDDEELLAECRAHPVVMAAPLLLLGAATAGAAAIAVEFPRAPVSVAWVLGAMVLLPALWCVGRFTRWRATRVLVTSNRIVVLRGVLSRRVVQLRLQRVSEVHVAQTLGERLIGRGRLLLEVPGDDVMVVDDVRRPRRIQRLVTSRLDEMRTEERRAEDGGDDAHAGIGWAGATTSVPASGASRAWDAPPARGASRAWDAAPFTDAARRRHGGGADEATPPHGMRLPAAVTSTTEPPGATAAWASTPAASVPDQLVQLDDLRRRGIITDAEFSAKKSELLRRL